MRKRSGDSFKLTITEMKRIVSATRTQEGTLKLTNWEPPITMARYQLSVRSILARTHKEKRLVQTKRITKMTDLMLYSGRYG